MTKVADASPVNAGDQIGYVITVSNTGAGTAHNVTVTDTLPTNAGLSWSIDAGGSSSGWSISAVVLSFGPADLAAGASTHVHIISPTTSATCGTVNNSASVTTSNDGSASVGPVPITVNCAVIHITKVADASSVNAGDPIGYVITVSNTGAGTAHNVTVTDTLPTNAGLSWSIDAGGSSSGWSISAGVLSFGPADLAAGASTHVHITSPTTSATCGTVNNSASVTTSNDGSASVGPVGITVNCPVVAQITPTATTCSQFNSGSAQDLNQVQYAVKSGKISQVNPGVFFYWVKVTAVAGQN